MKIGGLRFTFTRSQKLIFVALFWTRLNNIYTHFKTQKLIFKALFCRKSSFLSRYFQIKWITFKLRSSSFRLVSDRKSPNLNRNSRWRGLQISSNLPKMGCRDLASWMPFRVTRARAQATRAPIKRECRDKHGAQNGLQLVTPTINYSPRRVCACLCTRGGQPIATAHLRPISSNFNFSPSTISV